MEKSNSRINKRRRFIIAAAIFFAAVLNPSDFFGIIGKILSVLSPIIIGMAAAFVMNRPVCAIYDLSLSCINRRKSRPPIFFLTSTGVASSARLDKKIWLLSITAAYAILAAIIAGLVMIVVPQLIISVRGLMSNVEIYREKLSDYYAVFAQKDTFGILPAITSAAESIAGKIPEIAAAAYGRTTDFIGAAADFIIGLVVSVYILASKETLISLTKSLAARFLTSEGYSKAAGYYRLIYDVFSRFVGGQITEAAVLGGLCFAGMTLFGFEYSMLISVIIGVTALVPVAGAIIGTIPCAFLLFLVKPSSAAWFVVFIIVLQQLENNFIYPRIVGKSMGLPPLPVLLAILIGAKTGGAAGILLAVPLTAVIFGLINSGNCPQSPAHREPPQASDP